jgi:hypothetical protein
MLDHVRLIEALCKTKNQASAGYGLRAKPVPVAATVRQFDPARKYSEKQNHVPGFVKPLRQKYSAFQN